MQRNIKYSARFGSAAYFFFHDYRTRSHGTQKYHLYTVDFRVSTTLYRIFTRTVMTRNNIENVLRTYRVSVQTDVEKKKRGFWYFRYHNN